jgi:Geranylgeranyl pyrophosphate synthase
MPQTPITQPINTMADVWEAYRDELEGMERQARTNLDSSVALVNTVAAHILNSGGKRIRPFLLLLSARLCGYTGRDHYQLASLVSLFIPHLCSTTMSSTTPISAEADRPPEKSGATKSASCRRLSLLQSLLPGRRLPEPCD